MSTDKTFFKEGDLVILDKELPNKPIMMVEKIEKTQIPNDEGVKILFGIRCIWFDKNWMIQWHRFNFKDLRKADKNDY